MPPTRVSAQPWYSSVNIDLFVRVANNSIFHPFICWLVPLCLRAGETPYHEPVMWNTIGWAIFITIVSIFLPIGDKKMFGQERELDHEEEVVVITGGASGLGRCLAEIYAMKGGSVAVLDERPEDEETALEGVKYYECDIADRAAVEKCWAKIKEDLGTPTILINNAAIVHGKKMLDLTQDEVERSFRVNVLSQYHLNSLFLPPLANRAEGGTLVTVSSVTGHLGAAQLSAYSATKAALTAMHASLRAELALSHPNVRTLLVSPGQLSTELFAGVELGPLARAFAPTVEVSELAVQLVKTINAGEGGVVCEPVYARWIDALHLLPWGVQYLLRKAAEVDTAMQTWRGREGTKEVEGGFIGVVKPPKVTLEKVEPPKLTTKKDE